MQCRPEDDVMLVFILGLTQAHSHDISEGFLLWWPLALMQATSSTFSETAPLKNSWSTVYGNVRQTMQIRLRCLCSGLVQVVCRLFNGRFYAWPLGQDGSALISVWGAYYPLWHCMGQHQGKIAEHFTDIPARTPAIEVSTRPSEGKKGMHCSTDDVTLDTFIDCIRRCAISRIIEIPQLGIWSAAGGECCAWSWGISIETDRCIWAPTVKWPCPEDLVLVIKW